MKNALLLSFLLLTICVGCKKLEPATMTLTTNFDATSYVVSGNVAITYNGGTENFTEQGYIYSYSDEPTLHDRYGTITIVNENVKELTFSFQGTLPNLDTVFYIRAYTKTNGGVGYSNIDTIKTY